MFLLIDSKTLILVPMNLFKIITRGEWKAEFHEKNLKITSHIKVIKTTNHMYILYIPMRDKCHFCGGNITAIIKINILVSEFIK